MTQTPPKINSHILEEATSWFIDLNEAEPDLAMRQRFDNWLRTSPEHVRAYLQVSVFWEDTRALSKPTSIAALVERARADSENIVQLKRSSWDFSPAPEQVDVVRSRLWPRAVGYAAVLLGVVGSGLLGWQLLVRGVYQTEIGEQRSILLEDGSTVELNSRTRLRVRFDINERAVELRAGQALFRVAKEAQRPFIVRTDGTSVRAVGTAFDVYKRSTGTVVTVVEGKVAVLTQQAAASQADLTDSRSARGKNELQGQGSMDKSAVRKPPALRKALPDDANSVGQGSGVDAQVDAESGEIFLAAGEQIAVGARSTSRPEPADVAMVTAWTQKKLVFDETPLREVVEEFNRYNRQQLVIHDADLEDFHISATFPSTDSERLTEFLRRRFGVTLQPHDGEIEIARRQGGNEEASPNPQ